MSEWDTILNTSGEEVFNKWFDQKMDKIYSVVEDPHTAVIAAIVLFAGKAQSINKCFKNEAHSKKTELLDGNGYLKRLMGGLTTDKA